MAEELGAIKWSIEVDASNLGRAEAAMDKTGEAVVRTGKQVSQSAKEIDTSFEKAASSVKKVVAAYLGFQTIKAAVSSALTVTRDFSHSISELSAITGATGKDLKFYADQARAIGATTSLSGSQAAEAFKLIASAKPDLLASAEALNRVTREAVTLAEAAGITLPDAAKALGNSLNQFGAGADQANRYINVLAAGAKFGASSIEDTTQALQNSGAAANAAGLSFEETNAAIQAMAAGGIVAAEAGTGLRNVILILEGQANDQLKPSVVGVAKAMEGLAAQELSLTEMTDMFGRQNVVAAQTLVDQAHSVAELERSMTGTTTATEQAAAMMDDWRGDLKNAESAVEELQISVVERLMPGLRSATQAFSEFTVAAGDFVKSDEFGVWFDRAASAVDFLASAIKERLENSVTVLTVRMMAAAAEAVFFKDALNDLTATQLRGAISVMKAERDAAEATIFRMEQSSKGYAAQTRAIEIQKARLDEINGRLKDYGLQLSDLTNGVDDNSASVLTAAGYIELMGIKSEEAAEATETLTSASRGFTEEENKSIVAIAAQRAQLAMSGREAAIFTEVWKAYNDGAGPDAIAIIAETAGALYDQEQAVESAADATKAAAKTAADAAKKAADDVAEANGRAAKEAAEDWRDFRQAGGRAFADLVEDGDNAVDALLKSWKRLALEGFGQLAISSVAGMLGMNASSGVVGGMLGGIAGGGGIMAAGSQFMGGLTGGAIGTNSMIATGASSAGAGINAAIGAIPGWGWAAMATAAAATLLSKEKTPSFNAGLLLESLPGIGNQFDTERFASGLNVEGFARRSSQADAEKVIELFRDIDATFTQLSKDAGFDVALNRGNFTGLDERGLGSGLFLGTAGESGDAITNLQQQIDTFAMQWINAIKDQLSPTDYEAIIAAGGAEAMATKYKEIVDAQTKALDDAAKDQELILRQRMSLQDEYDNLTMTSAELLDRQRNALHESNRALFDSIQAITAAKQAEQARIAVIASQMAMFQDAVSDTFSAFDGLLDNQRDAIRDHYGDLLQMEEDLHRRRQGLFRSLQDTITGLKLGDMSALSRQAKLDLAQAEFRSLAGIAGNTSLSMQERVTAAEGLKGAADSYLNAGQGMFASSSQYKDIFAEVIGSLEGARFLGTTGEFDPTAINNAMLQELQLLNEQTSGLPQRIAAELAVQIANLISTGRSLGVSDTVIANQIRNQGPQAVAAAEVAAPGFVAGNATSVQDMNAYISMLKSTPGITGEQLVTAAADRAKELGLSSAYLGTVIKGSGGASVDQILKQYGIQPFEDGTNFVPHDQLAYIHQGERIVPAADNQSLMAADKELAGKVDRLIDAVETTNRILMAGGDFSGKQMTENNKVLKDLADSLKSKQGVGSAKYANAA